MSALDLDSKYNGRKIVPFFRFEKRQEFRLSEEGTHEIAYVKVQVLEPDGKPEYEEFSFPNGTTFKRKVMRDDLEQPITKTYLYVRPFGSKDEVAHDAESTMRNWEKQSNMPEGMFPRYLYEAFEAGYKQFKDGTSITAKGIKISEWNGISPQMQGYLISQGITTVEALADANEQMLMIIGTGGRGMQNQAKNWLEGKRERQVDVLEETAKSQAEEIADLKASMAQMLALMKAGAEAAKFDAIPRLGEALEQAPTAAIVKAGGTLHLPVKK
jgi:hypothetical protein